MITATLQQPRVLIIDDDTLTRFLVRRTLEGSNMVVLEAEDGAIGLEVFRTQAPDIVLLDVIMPNMDGFATCRAIHQMPMGEHIPILMLTGLDDAESIERCYEAGATDFITKPITWPLLRHRIRYMLRASHALLNLAKSQASLANAQRVAALGSWDWDLSTRKIFWSNEIFRICGLTAGQEAAKLDTFLNVVKAEERDHVGQSIKAALKKGLRFALDHSIVRPDASERVVHLLGEPTFDETGKVISFAGTLQDITERRRAEEKIRYLAFYDSLTGLPNRQWFNEMFSQAEARAKRYGAQMAILCLGLDRFKLINDTLGHNVGDRLLQEVAARLKGCLRSYDPVAVYNDMNIANDVARFGGDEFTVIVNDVKEAQDVTKVARRILNAIAVPFSFDGHEISVSASIGIALYPNDGMGFDDLLKNADGAMFHAKEQGRGDFQFYTESMNAASLEKLSLENRLRKSIERKEFQLHYQPKVDLQTGRISGMEALIRWPDPELGIISPARFIPIAEETGLIIPIGEWVLRTACGQAEAWHMAGYTDLSMAVNVSARQFRQKNFPQLVRDTLSSTGLKPQYLELELTESVLMHDDKDLIETLRELKEIGVALSLDDFGTGYSSLSYLRNFPIDIVKIDQAFIRDLNSSIDDASLTKAIIAMAQSLNMKTIAEGVETQSQLGFLCAHHCDAIQGYYFSKPIPADELTALLREGKCIEKSDLIREQSKQAVLFVKNDENVVSAVKTLLRREGYDITSTSIAEDTLARFAVTRVDVTGSGLPSADDVISVSGSFVNGMPQSKS